MKIIKKLALVTSMAIALSSVPVFAQETNETENITLIQGEAEVTTEAALKARCIFNKNLFRTNLVQADNGEIGQGFGVSYEWNDKWFFNDNKLFNQGLCKTSSLLAALSYYSSDSDYAMNDESASTYTYAFSEDASDISSIQGIMAVMENHGLEDVQEYNLRDYADDNHVAQFNIGHKEVTNEKEAKNLVVMTIRGTRGEIEWLSNFAMGSTDEFGSIEGWTEEENHMGFDIAANRIVELTRSYMADNNLEDGETVFWITGHSRGAALANLVGKKIEDLNYDTYTYTFATPNNTVDQSAPNQYPSIFNIVNEDDIVTAIPAEGWQFTKYGRTINTELNTLLKIKWATIIGKPYSANLSSSLDKTITTLGNVVDHRNEFYNYTGNQEEITLTQKFYSEAKRQEALDSIPAACLPYADIELFETKSLIGTKVYGYTMVQQPMYFMTAAGLNLAGSMGATEFLTFNVADKYSDAKTRLIISGIEGLSHPHYMESYVLLAYSNQLRGVPALAEASEAQLFIEE